MAAKQAQEALIYALVNALAGFTLVMGGMLLTGDHTVTAVLSALGIGLLMFGNYLANVQDDIDIEAPDASIIGGKKRKGSAFFNVFRRREIFRFI